MELIEDKAIIRGMMRGDRGEDLLGALEQIAALADWHDAYVTGTGELALVEFTSEAAETYEDARILNLSGRIRKRATGISVELNASVEVAGKVHAGRIEAALCGQVLLVVDAVVPAALASRSRPASAPHERSTAPRAAAAGSPAASPRRGAVTPAPRRPSSPFESSSASHSPALRRDRPKIQPLRRQQPVDELDDDDDDAYLEVEAGDFLQHPQLGLCRVVGEDDSGGTRITVDGGRIRVLRLDALLVRSPTVDEQGRRVFPVIGPRKRR